MKITHVEIENYRAIRKMEIDLDPQDDCLVLAGLNGSGKSSFLEAVLTGLGTPFDMREQLKGQDYRVVLDLLEEGFTGRLVATGKYKPKNVPQFSACYFSSWRAPKRVHGVPLMVGKKGKRPAKEERNALWNLKQCLVSLPSLASYSSGSDMKDKLSRIYKSINALWTEFYPGQKEQFEVDIENGGTEEVQALGTEAEPKFELYLKKKGGRRISVDELSSGEIELLALFGTLIADRELKGKPHDFVFLDEPELHLNPVWHRMLVPLLRKYSPGTQFFIASHSPAIWDSVYSGQRVFFEDGGIANEGVNNG